MQWPVQRPECTVQGLKVVGHRATKVCNMLDGCALASVRVARGLESVLGVGFEFVVLVLSVVRHVDINLARYATRGVVSSARTSAHRSAKETRHTVSEGYESLAA